MIELVRRSLAASLDGGPPTFATATGPFRIAAVPDAHDCLVLAFEAARATLTLELAPRAELAGHAWRQTWTLEVHDANGDVVGTLDPATRVELARATDGARVYLRVARRGFVHTLATATGDETVTVPIRDVAHLCYTQQSSEAPASDEPDALAPYARPTLVEAAPWWEIDLGRAYYVGWFRLDLAPLPADAIVEVELYGYRGVDGRPPARSAIAIERRAPADASVAWIVGAEAALGRYLRVTARAAGGVALAVRGAEIMASDIAAATLYDTVVRAAVLYRERVYCERPRATYAEVWTRATALARALAGRHETRRGPRPVIAVALGNRLAWTIVELAIIQRGYVAVAVSPDDDDARLAAILTRTRAVCAIAEDAIAARIARLAPAIDVIRADALDEVYAQGRRARVCKPVRDRSEDDPFAILFTSGSTGAPKGAMRTYRAFHAVVADYHLNHAPRHVSFQPLSHLSERMYLPTVWMWGGVVTFSRGAAHLFDEFRAFEPTTVGGVPRIFEVVFAQYRRRVRALAATEPTTPRAALEARALAEARATFGTRLQAVSVGSAPVGRELFAFMKRCFADVYVTEGYGSTEVGSITHDHKIADGVDVKLVPVAGSDDPARGEIYVRSPHAITGYLEDDGYRSPLDADGYFATGDLGERDDEGRVRVIGRLRNTVKLAQGEFVSAERIEAALGADPIVDRIYVHVESGAPAVAAYVSAAPDELARLRARHPERDDRACVLAALHARGRAVGLAAYELPRAIALADAPLTLEDGLLTASGKLARGELARRFGPALSALAHGTATAIAQDDDEEGDDDLLARVVHVARAVIGGDVDPHAPLASGLGVDSLAAAELLAALGDELGRDTPLAWWIEARSLADLAARLARFAGDDAGATAELADRDRRDPGAYAPRAPVRSGPPRRVLLTGATGFLGAHLVEALRARGVAAVCLVRAADDASATARLREALARYAIPHGDDPDVVAIAGDLADTPERLRATLAPHAPALDAIVHAGAHVSWLASYHALRAPNVLGTRALLAVAAEHGLAMHHVSTISTVPAGGDESSRRAFAHALAGTPYGLSKWVAELACVQARAQGTPVAIYRPGMIANHATRGTGNPDDFVNRYLAGCLALGCYVDRDDAICELAPVDHVAAAIAALVIARPDPDATYHLINTARSPSYARVGRALAAQHAGLRPVSYADFRAALRGTASRLAPLAAFFPADGGLGAGTYGEATTLTALAALGIAPPTIDDAILATYARYASSRESASPASPIRSTPL